MTHSHVGSTTKHFPLTSLSLSFLFPETGVIIPSNYTETGIPMRLSWQPQSPLCVLNSLMSGPEKLRVGLRSHGQKRKGPGLWVVPSPLWNGHPTPHSHTHSDAVGTAACPFRVLGPKGSARAGESGRRLSEPGVPRSSVTCDRDRPPLHRSSRASSQPRWC